jgi:hypothetical protein
MARPDPPSVELESWYWSLLSAGPHVRYRLAVDCPGVLPPGSEGLRSFVCDLRYSDLHRVEAHHTVRQARSDGRPVLPPMPEAHAVPVVGKYLATEAEHRVRALEVRAYLQGLLQAGGGIAASLLQILEDFRVRPAPGADPPASPLASALGGTGAG